MLDPKFFKSNKKLLPSKPLEKADSNPSFLEKHIQDEIKKLPRHIQRQMARSKKNVLL